MDAFFPIEAIAETAPLFPLKMLSMRCHRRIL
jgi:hypothetical protein